MQPWPQIIRLNLVNLWKKTQEIVPQVFWTVRKPVLFHMLMTECGETQSQIRNALLSTKWNVDKIRKISQNYATNQNPIIHNSLLLFKVRDWFISIFPVLINTDLNCGFQPSVSNKLQLKKLLSLMNILILFFLFNTNETAPIDQNRMTK